MADKTTVPLVSVKLKKQIMHAGKRVDEGTDLKVPQTLIPWLAERGVIVAPAAPSTRI